MGEAPDEDVADPPDISEDDTPVSGVAAEDRSSGDGASDPPLQDDRPIDPSGGASGALDIPASPPAPSTPDDPDFDGPQVSGPGSDANVPYTPPDPQPTVMEAGGSDDEPDHDAPEHDLEDEETRRRSEGEGSGQDEPAEGF